VPQRARLRPLLAKVAVQLAAAAAPIKFVQYGSDVEKKADAQSGVNTCWAACFAYVTGKSQLAMRLDASLDASIYGAVDADSDAMATTAGLTKVAAWNTGLGKLPMIVGLPAHFVVLIWAAVKPPSEIVVVKYWDPDGGVYKKVSIQDFVKLNPTIGYH
jgi:hypothetical protein